MNSFELSDFAALTGGQLSVASAENGFDRIAYDSRRVREGSSYLFVAMRTSQNDGHRYLKEAWDKGVRNFLVSDDVDTGILTDSTVLQVEDVLSALQKMAAFRRSEMKLDVWGITGSNGKTVVKEWLNQLLAEDKRIVRTPRSYNSQLGVPLSLWNVEDYHELGLFEVGISQPGEMELQQKVLQPDQGIFINVGSAHLEHFKDREELAAEKMLLFRNCKQLLRSSDYPEINKAAEILPNKVQQLSWSMRGNPADLRLTGKELNTAGAKLNLSYLENDFEIEIPFRDEASIENSLACILAMLRMGYSSDEIRERTTRLTPVAMRMEVINGVNHCILINDSYNSDINALGISLDILEQQSVHRNKTVILSDLFQTGLSEKDLYQKVYDLLKAHKVQKVICIGEKIGKSLKALGMNVESYSETDEFMQALDLDKFDEEAILIKGARHFAFERIVSRFELRVHDTILEIDLDKMAHNLKVYRSMIPRSTKVMAVVKAFSYGSGSDEVARFLEYQKVDYLAVAYADEGIHLRVNGISTPIMVMNPERSSLESLIRFRLEPELSRFGQLRAFVQELRKRGIEDYPVHLKLDTGMNRLGFREEVLEELLNELKNAEKYIKVVSVFSHLAASEDPGYRSFTLEQIDAFERMSGRIEGHLSYSFIRHLCNSGAIPAYPQAHYEMVRLGIGLYGVDPGSRVASLQPVGTLKTVVSQVKRIKAGESVGYGRSYIAQKDMEIAILPIGYADGYRRSLSNGKAYVRIKDERCEVVGNVCMDMTMVNVSGMDVNAGDEVIVMGEDPDVQDLAEWMDTIAYEVLTSIPPRVKRVFVQE